jgi:hypothetical protein
MSDKLRLRVLLEIRKKMNEAQQRANQSDRTGRVLWMQQYFALRKFFGTVQYNWTKWKKQEATEH